MSPTLRPITRRFRNTPLRVVQINSKRQDGRIDSYWTVTPLRNEDGKRYRPHFASKAEAEAEKGRRERERRLFGLEGSQMSTALRVDAIQAQRILAPLKATLLTAAKHYAAHLDKAAESSAAKTVAEAKEEYLAKLGKAKDQKKDTRLAESSLRNIRCRMNVFCNGIEGNSELLGLGELKLPDVSHVELTAFLENLPMRSQTVAHYRAQIHNFFEFVRGKGWVAANPVRHLTRIKRNKAEDGARILSVDQAQQLLDAAVEAPLARILVPRIALGLFLGLRPSEAANMRWEKIDFSNGHVEVEGSTGKKRQQRFVELNPTARAWLCKYRAARGRIFDPEASKVRRAWDSLRKTCGWRLCSFPTKEDEFEHNVLRHCFASYMLAKTQNREKTVELMGTSLVTFANYYRVAMPPDWAKKYWAILPEGASHPNPVRPKKIKNI